MTVTTEPMIDLAGDVRPGAVPSPRRGGGSPLGGRSRAHSGARRTAVRSGPPPAAPTPREALSLLRQAED